MCSCFRGTFFKRRVQNTILSQYSGRGISLNIVNSSFVTGHRVELGGQIAGAVVVAIGEAIEMDGGDIEGGLDKISVPLELGPGPDSPSFRASMLSLVERPMLKELWP
jgi:hypothetical protein